MKRDNDFHNVSLQKSLFETLKKVKFHSILTVIRDLKILLK